MRWWSLRPAQRQYAREHRRRLKREAFGLAPSQLLTGRLGLAEIAHRPPVLAICERYVAGWPVMRNHGLGLYFTGGTSAGRSLAVNALTHELIDRCSAPARVVHMPESANRLREMAHELEKMGRWGEAEKLRGAALLVLAELGLEETSLGLGSLLRQVVDYRLEAGLPMVVSSPLSLGQVADRYSPQLASRLDACCSVVDLFDGDPS